MIALLESRPCCSWSPDDAALWKNNHTLLFLSHSFCSEWWAGIMNFYTIARSISGDVMTSNGKPFILLQKYRARRDAIERAVGKIGPSPSHPNQPVGTGPSPASLRTMLSSVAHAPLAPNEPWTERGTHPAMTTPRTTSLVGCRQLSRGRPVSLN